jgi:hypothetical protein
MAVPSSGTISLTDIQAEFGGPGSPISLGNYYKNGLYVTATSDAPNVPTSGPIALSDFYGARKLSLYTFTYTGDGTFVLPSSFAGDLIVNAMLGGGGGGGGNDAGQIGYSGYPGGFLTGGTISANPGDTVQIYTGSGGGAGTSNAGGAAGGVGGPSASVNWSTLNMLGTPGNYRSTNNAYSGFLNTYGIWSATASASMIFDQTVSVNFPFNGTYLFTGSADNLGTIYVDGVAVLSLPEDGYGGSYSASVNIIAGNHNVRVYGFDTGQPGAIGLTIVGGGFSGGNGGTAGASGASGGGGGGGGGTVILINNSIQAVAPGGGGGGGAGYNSGGRPNQNTPGNNGTYYGGAGANNGGDGGGGGGGAGGFNGGAGGVEFGGDEGAYSGENGAPLTPSGGATSTGTNGGGPTAPGGSGYVTVSYYA